MRNPTIRSRFELIRKAASQLAAAKWNNGQPTKKKLNVEKAVQHPVAAHPSPFSRANLYASAAHWAADANRKDLRKK
jgi:hypothetical protein